MFPKKYLNILFLFFISISCTNELDFSQIDDYSAKPEYIGAVTYFTVLPLQFFNQSGVQETERTDITDFKIFENDYLKKNLVKIDFNVEIKNEYNTAFVIQANLLDENGNDIYVFKELTVAANNLDYKFIETIEVSANPNIKNTAKVKVVVKFADSSVVVDPNAKTEFQFKSSVKIYLDTV